MSLGIIGVDPGGRETGIAAIVRSGVDTVLYGSTTVRRVDVEPLLEMPPEYLLAVAGEIREVLDGLRADGHEAMLAIEQVTPPSWRVKGKVSPIKPDAIMATSIVLGAVLGRAWGIPIVAVRPGGNGAGVAVHGDGRWAHYPERLRPKMGGKGSDKLRHERSAYDCAVRGLATRRLATARGGIYA